ncbi:MAG: co-chaperone GroES [Nitrospirae bacterium CG_4_9_14_3_um_filter_53_35]|nr:MAG: hypothetical protein AUK29_00805 [Nitrospirae bacterium CG2_30_53_67]PIS37942.1 MAG: co-chaperone GroES [Nitrospirae bacterium CG08_land_8_20_14_0_20_52_24]PIV83356.1 MAG: co-chaperone GroES [Nitrospirae bacterium CG17_big_fil_post_rev_8_21_14_2_50_50_9]PIW84203.1 MAG: co-chaperone GroES [Nitrospirae bacterium CG_4_8_14_3_um_filter_50_41]PIX85219.1 MAG: co-chaperone GroES [Nitrospirae bacterium CG_4_10_14_3_um_filter_53_41]PJA72888.1 MAG: co-chaperone GroES [Nitrospirae bacterium CG_4_
MKIRPLNDWVLIKPEPSENRSSGGILIPDSAKEKPTRGIVVAAGRGCYEEERDKKGNLTGEKKFIKIEVKPDDKILFRRFGVDEVKVKGEEFVMVRERDILGTL